MAITSVSTSTGTHDITQLILSSCRVQCQLARNTRISKLLKQFVTKYDPSVRKRAIDASLKIYGSYRRCSSGQRFKKGSFAHGYKDSEDEKLECPSPKVSIEFSEPQLRRNKVPLATVRERKLSSHRDVHSHTSRNRLHFTSHDDPPRAKHNTLPLSSAASNNNIHACSNSLRKKKYQVASNNECSWASSLPKKSLESKNHDGLDSVSTSFREKVTLSLPSKSHNRIHLPSQSPTPPSTRSRSPQQSLQICQSPSTKRLGMKNYHVFTFPMPPTGPSLTSLYYQLPPEKGNYLQVLVKFSAESNDQLWTTLLQGALMENCVKELCIAIGRMYVKSDLSRTTKPIYFRNPQNATRAVTIFKQYLAIGGQTLLKMVKVLIDKMKSDSIKGKWEKRKADKIATLDSHAL